MAAPKWQDDSSTNNCNGCAVEFSFFNRRHHCRRDGKIFCGDCASQFAPLPQLGLEEAVRLCNPCYELTIRENRFLVNHQPFLSEGGMLVRYSLRDEPAPVVMKLSTDTKRLTWHSTQLIRNQPASFDSLALDNVTDVRAGAEGDVFQAYQNMNHKTSQCFCITAKRPGGYLTLELEASSQEERDKWVDSMKGAVEYYQGEKRKAPGGRSDEERAERDRAKEEDRKRRADEIRKKYGIGQS
eukprot:CAMPEP_0201507844 /NCGR_PEP_ID=MMETSP0161_2-20130828/1383_1 /ASSEMBLY_ACC=CAM_ASM_000251 /TAXON_ID=180227 /ORGANISM="Neoparamoeba aestuarina, Strain SoJaBio B1-5/56/2" /LENGTH=240 /DNA_ID=CAMNT_0047902319 /DNA_START=161 /DNA_END=883 /DNA_ORIENTATION=-